MIPKTSKEIFNAEDETEQQQEHAAIQSEEIEHQRRKFDRNTLESLN